MKYIIQTDKKQSEKRMICIIYFLHLIYKRHNLT